MLCVAAAGSVAWLRGDSMSICSNLQWFEFEGIQGCVNSWEFSMGEQHMKACQWLQSHIWSCKIGKVGSRTFSAQETASPGLEHLCHTCIWGVFTKSLICHLYDEPFQAWQYYFWCSGYRLMMNTNGRTRVCMPFPFILDFWPYVSLEEAKGPTCRGTCSYILNVAVEG